MSKFAHYADVINEPFTKITKIQLWSGMAADVGGRVAAVCHSGHQTRGPGTLTDTVAPNITARAKQFIAEARCRASTGSDTGAAVATVATGKEFLYKEMLKLDKDP